MSKQRIDEMKKFIQLSEGLEEAIHKGRKGGKQSIDLSGPDGNAFVLLGYATSLGRQLGYTSEQMAAIQSEMKSGDYENLLTVFDREFGDYVDLYRGEDDEDEDLEEGLGDKVSGWFFKKGTEPLIAEIDKFGPMAAASRIMQKPEKTQRAMIQGAKHYLENVEDHAGLRKFVAVMSTPELEEGFEKGSIRKKMNRYGWFFQGVNPKELINHVRSASDKELVQLARAANEYADESSPRDLQMKLIVQELKRRHNLTPKGNLREDESEDGEMFYVIVIDGSDRCVARLEKFGRSWHEECVFGDSPYGFGSKTYMSYLTPEDIIGWLNQDYKTVVGPFENEYDAEIEMDRMAEEEGDADESWMYEDANQLDEIKMNTAINALRKMKSSAEDYYSSSNDQRRVNRFRNAIKRRWGEKGAEVADTVSAGDGYRQDNTQTYDQLAGPSVRPDQDVLKAGPRKGKLRQGRQELSKSLAKANLRNIRGMKKPRLPEGEVFEDIDLSNIVRSVLSEGAYEDYLRKTDPLGGFDEWDMDNPRGPRIEEPKTNLCPNCEGMGCDECEGEGEVFESGERDLTTTFEDALEIAYEMADADPETESTQHLKKALVKAGGNGKDLKAFYEWLDEQGVYTHPSLLEASNLNEDGGSAMQILLGMGGIGAIALVLVHTAVSKILDSPTLWQDAKKLVQNLKDKKEGAKIDVEAFVKQGLEEIEKIPAAGMRSYAKGRLAKAQYVRDPAELKRLADSIVSYVRSRQEKEDRVEESDYDDDHIIDVGDDEDFEDYSLPHNWNDDNSLDDEYKRGLRFD